VPKVNYGMHMFEEMKGYVGLTDADDERLRDLEGRLGDRDVEVVDHFYERILSTPDARAVLQDEAQITRLKSTLVVWLHELLAGPRDQAYYDRRRRIGHKHVDVGLPSRFMFTAMSVMCQDLCDIAQVEYDGETFHAVCTALRRATDLDLAIMTGTYVEARELRQLANLQELVLTRLPIAAVIADNNDVVTAATGPATALLGGDSVIGRTWQEVFPAALREAAELDTMVAAAVATARSQVLPRMEVQFGSRRYFRVTVVPIDHAQTRVLIHLEDLTDALDAEARLHRSESLAQIGALSAAVAHELRNPLAGMSGALQVIRRSYEETDSRHQILIKVEAQISRLNGLVTELLQFARPVEPTVEDVRLEELARSAADLVRTSHPALDITVDGGGCAFADRALTHGILLNLMNNAAQAVDGEGRIQIQVDGGSIRIEDSGAGIGDDIRDQIFQPFFTTRTRGTGLGLAICRKSAQSMGADISLVKAETLSGAAFALRFLVRR
jgi:signal transduction histidine kinase